MLFELSDRVTLSCRGRRFRHKPPAIGKSENRSPTIIERSTVHFTILSRSLTARFDAEVSLAAILRGRSNLHGSPRGTGPIVGIVGGRVAVRRSLFRSSTMIYGV